jgi:hypothetical protein
MLLRAFQEKFHAYYFVVPGIYNTWTSIDLVIFVCLFGICCVGLHVALPHNTFVAVIVFQEINSEIHRRVL